MHMEDDKSLITEGLGVGVWPLDVFHNKEFVWMWQSPHTLWVGQPGAWFPPPDPTWQPASWDQLWGLYNLGALVSENPQSPLLPSL